MANGDASTVDMRSPSGTVFHVPKENVLRAKLKYGWIEVPVEKAEEGKTGKAVEQPRLWEALNRPVGEKEFQAKGLTEGVSQKSRFAIANIVGKMNISDDNKRRLAYALDIPMELIMAPAEAGRKMTTPLSVGTVGLGGLLSRLRALQASLPVRAAVGTAEAGGSTYFGAQGAGQAIEPRRKDERLSDYLERVLGGAGQALAGLVGVTHAGGPAAEKTAKTAVREYSNVGERKLIAQETETKAKQATAKVEARSAAEAKEAEVAAKQAKANEEHRAAVDAAKLKHQAEIEAYEQSVSGRVTKEAHARLKNTRLEAAEKKMATFRDQTAKDMVKNFDQAERAEREQLDQRYQDFRQKILGVTPEQPNGTLQSELSPIGEAVIYARKNLLKGSRTNITIFNDIMGRLKDAIETPEGELKPLAGQMIPTDQLRGYYRELGDAIYDRDLPGDVREALKHVQDKIQSQVKATVQDVHGPTAVKVYDDLSKDWANYKRIWFDVGSVNPVPRIRRMLRDPITQQEGVEVWQRIAQMVKGEKGNAIVTLMAKKQAFGANPSLPARLMALDKKLSGLKTFYETVPVTKYPRAPQYKEPAAPEKVAGPTVSKYDVPEPFDREKTIREAIQKRMESTGNWGTGIALTTAGVDLLRSLIPGSTHTISAMSVAERVALAQLIKRILTGEKFVNWASRD